jgi:hypothetical protein
MQHSPTNCATVAANALLCVLATSCTTTGVNQRYAAIASLNMASIVHLYVLGWMVMTVIAVANASTFMLQYQMTMSGQLHTAQKH